MTEQSRGVTRRGILKSAGAVAATVVAPAQAAQLAAPVIAATAQAGVQVAIKGSGLKLLAGLLNSRGNVTEWLLEFNKMAAAPAAIKITPPEDFAEQNKPNWICHLFQQVSSQHDQLQRLEYWKKKLEEAGNTQSMTECLSQFRESAGLIGSDGKLGYYKIDDHVANLEQELATLPPEATTSDVISSLLKKLQTRYATNRSLLNSLSDKDLEPLTGYRVEILEEILPGRRVINDSIALELKHEQFRLNFREASEALDSNTYEEVPLYSETGRILGYSHESRISEELKKQLNAKVGEMLNAGVPPKRINDCFERYFEYQNRLPAHQRGYMPEYFDYARDELDLIEAHQSRMKGLPEQGGHVEKLKIPEKPHGIDTYRGDHYTVEALPYQGDIRIFSIRMDRSMMRYSANPEKTERLFNQLRTNLQPPNPHYHFEMHPDPLRGNPMEPAYILSTNYPGSIRTLDSMIRNFAEEHAKSRR